MKKRLLKLACFFLIFITVFYQVWETLSYKLTYSEDIFVFKQFYETPNNTIDVMFFGNSHCYCAVNTSVLYDKYGISSYILGGAGKNLANIYYSMEEALKTQQPKVFFLELCCLNEEIQVDKNLYRNTLTMNFSKTFFDNINAIVPENDKFETLLKFPIFHSRYNDLTELDFTSKAYFNRGSYSKHIVTPYEPPILTTEVTPVSKHNLYYLEKIIQLSKNKNIPLVFISVPYDISDTYQGRVNYAKALAEKNNIPFIDFNYIYKEIGFDYSTDLYDYDHVNFTGSKKVSNYIADFINSNYDLPNHKGDVNYELWDLDLKFWQHFEKNNELTLANSQQELLNQLKVLDEDYTIILSFTKNNENFNNDLHLLNSYLNQFGIFTSNLEKDGIYVIKNNKLIHSITYDNTWYTQLDRKNDLVIRTNENSRPELIINKKNLLSDNNINIIIYDNFLNQVAVKN